LIQKAEWRQILLKRRKEVSAERRTEASLLLREKVKPLGRILSFTTIGSEVDTKPLNDHLLSEGRLKLVPYTVESLFQVPLEEIDCILVPGLGFDKENYRLGYGKGFYDQFLAKATHILTIGVGFKEQLSEEPLPRDPWDIPVQELLLV